ncbi:MAG: hypothetical protein ACI9VS_000499 [Candidatus Binatia bacterium]|jgi:hypothetical protein
MVKPVRTPPTSVELDEAVSLVFDAVSRCFAYFRWWTRVRPVLIAATLHETDIVLQQNAVIEGTLLSIRKVNDFFRTRGNSRELEDDIFSYDFTGFGQTGKFLHPDDFTEIHKRIGHITLRQIREGRVTWSIQDATIAAATKFVDFAKFLETSFYASDESSRQKAADCRIAIENLMREMETAESSESSHV